MATRAEILAVADSMCDVSTKLKQAKSISDQALESNTVRAINWTSPEVEDVLATAGRTFSGQDVSNSIGSIDNYVKSWWATHGQNLEKLTKPIV